MKKLLLILNVILAGSLTNAQTTLLDENFDSYTDFAISGFGSWLTLDLDGLPTYTGGTETPEWNNAGDPQAFIIFNPTTAGVTNATSGDEVRNFDPHSGQKYAASWSAVPAQGGPSANNDWLISPAITLGASSNTLSFWVKSLSNTYGLDKYKVGIYVGSGTPNAASNFVTISGPLSLSAPYPDWQQKTYNLDTYAGQTIRIGIQCVSSDVYMLMVDDVKVTTGTLGTSEVGAKAKSANVYPNPTKGEINIKTDKKIKSSEIFDIAGRSILSFSSQKADLSSLTKGAYVLKIEFTDGSSTSEKIIKE